MIRFSLFRRGGSVPPALPASALVLGSLLWAAQPSSAEEQPSNPNVIVDYSVLDSLAGGTTAGGDHLPPPPQTPLSRLLAPGEAAPSSQTPPTVAPEATVQAVPTTPIQSTDLSAANATPAVDGAAAPTPASGPTDVAAAPSDAASTGPQGEQTAAKPPIEGMVRIPFEPDSNVISDAAKAALAPLVEKLNGDVTSRVQILAYAAGDEAASTHARGVSLARALAMRGYLSEQGIALGRMDLRALGNTAQEEPPDRVDLIPVPQ
jgi:outer membrane protein OmpA-like peptidoglycan-associated protein